MKTLTFFQSLIYFDRPVLLLATDAIGIKYICVLVQENPQTDDYLCVALSEGRSKELQLGQVDVRSVFEKPEVNERYLAKTIEGNFDTLSAVLVPAEDIKGTWYPLPGVYLNNNYISGVVVQQSVEKHRAIIHCSLNPPEAATESKISIPHLSQGLTRFQSLLEQAYKKGLSGLEGTLREELLSPSNYQLEVFGTARGSFTFQMQTVEPADLLGYSYIAKAFELIDRVALNIRDTKTALELISKNSGHFATAYKNLLEYVANDSVAFEYEWTMPEKKTSTKASIIPRYAQSLYNAIIEKADIGKEVFTVTGHFIGVHSEKRTWTFGTEQSEKKINGESSVDLAGITIQLKRYKINYEELLQRDGTGRESKKVVLTSYTEIK